MRRKGDVPEAFFSIATSSNQVQLSPFSGSGLTANSRRNTGRKTAKILALKESPKKAARSSLELAAAANKTADATTAWSETADVTTAASKAAVRVVEPAPSWLVTLGKETCVFKI
jgi:hypothetical protein